MTPLQLEQVVGAFVLAAGVPRWCVADEGTPTLEQPYAAVSIVSDEEDEGGGPGDTLIGASTGAVSYTGHRAFRIQVDVIGTASARTYAQRMALLWRADSAARRAVVAAGVGPSTASAVRMLAGQRGSAGLVQSASVDLLGYYRLTLASDDEPADLVDAITLDLTGVNGPDIQATEYVTALLLDDGEPLLLDDGEPLMLGA